MIPLLLVWLTLFAIAVIWAWVMPEGWSGEDDVDHDPPDMEDDDEEDCKPMDLLRMPQENLPE